MHEERLLLVMKFGGTSLADASRFKDVLNIVGAARRGGFSHPQPTREQPDRAAGVIVLSAMSGVTNGLIACAQEAQTGNSVGALRQLDDLKSRHLQVIDELFPTLRARTDCICPYKKQQRFRMPGIN